MKAVKLLVVFTACAMLPFVAVAQSGPAAHVPGAVAPTATIPPTPTATPSSGLTIITDSNLPAAAVGVPYSVQIEAVGGTTPYTWSVASGSLPPGLQLNSSTGVLSGTPSGTGSYNFTIQVTDSEGSGGGIMADAWANAVTAATTKAFLLQVDSISIPATGHAGRIALLLMVLAAGTLLVIRRHVA